MNFKDGKSEGIQKAYYESGNLRAYINIANGQGIEEEYYETGIIKLKAIIDTDDNGFLNYTKGTLYKQDGSVLRNMTHADLENLKLRKP